MSDNPYRADSNPVAQPPVEQVKPRTFAPAIALIASGALNVMGSVWGVVSWALASAGIYPTDEMKEDQAAQMEELFADNPEFGDLFIQLQAFGESPYSLVLNILTLILGALVIFGGIKLMNVKSYGLVLFAAIINVIPLFTCCCYGLPIGIWVIVVLMSADVKAAFRSTSMEQ